MIWKHKRKMLLKEYFSVLHASRHTHGSLHLLWRVLHYVAGPQCQGPLTPHLGP